MGGPAGMADADAAAQRLEVELGGQVAQLALGAAAGNVATFQRRHAGAVIAAIFEALERIHQTGRNGFAAYDADNAAHAISPWLLFWREPSREVWARSPVCFPGA